MIREERYIVLKHENLSSKQYYNLVRFLERENISTVSAVVVESDWPEYEAVWKMIEERVNGV